ncbi:MAG: hypothetical protein ACRCYF_08445 [Shewanella sp.]
MNVDNVLSRIESADSILDVNVVLTKCMSNQTIQSVIKGENLNRILDVIFDLGCEDENPLSVSRLKAAASLGRLAAVARGRQSEIFESINLLLPDEPCDIELLDDGDEKSYASQSLLYIKYQWVIDYCFRQAILIDSAENARRTLIQTALKKCGDLSSAWLFCREAFIYLVTIDTAEARMKRARRVSRVWADVIRDWDGDVGDGFGNNLSVWLDVILSNSSSSVDSGVLVDIVNDALSMLIRVIELRFSNALSSESYMVLDTAIHRLGSRVWEDVIRHSTVFYRIRLTLKEAALVLAKQNITDTNIMHLLIKSYYSKVHVAPDITKHFSSAKELDPDVRDWWVSLGKVRKSRAISEHTVGHTEDFYIGGLLIKVEENNNVIDKLERAVVPFLEISDPPLASTVKKATANFSEMASVVRQLARVRKLTYTGILGSVIEYNPLQHEMLDGHQYGIRRVRVVKDGVEKEFSGKIKTLVKPWVVPDDE